MDTSQTARFLKLAVPGGLLTALFLLLFFFLSGTTTTPPVYSQGNPATPPNLVLVPIPTEDILVLAILPASSETVAAGTVTEGFIPTTIPATPIPATPTPTELSPPAETPEVAPPTATPLPPVQAAPALLSIPAIGMANSPVQAVGVEKIRQPDGSSALRWQARDAGVGYQPAGQGEICKWGLVTLNGHNWFRQQPGIFVNLHKLKTGDPIRLTTDAGVSCEYQVEWSRQYGPQDTSWLYEASAISNPELTYLNIYTCSADFKERYVVRASMPVSLPDNR
jgi:hypothetical protein